QRRSGILRSVFHGFGQCPGIDRILVELGHGAPDSTDCRGLKSVWQDSCMTSIVMGMRPTGEHMVSVLASPQCIRNNRARDWKEHADGKLACTGRRKDAGSRD